jgi:TusA-related sulfurtransferase
VRTVDALGTYCPVPLQLLDRALARAGEDEVVALLADDPLIEVDLPAWCHETGHRLMALRRDGDEWQGLVRRRRR